MLSPSTHLIYDNALSVLQDKLTALLDDGSGGAADEDPSAGTNALAMLAFLHLYLAIACSDGTVPSAHVIVKSELPIGAGRVNHKI